VCRVAPVPGETKVWQYITLTRRIYLIDCPGIVPTSAHDSQTATVLKGVLRVEALPTPSEHVPELLLRIKPLYLARTYGLTVPEAASWEADELLDTLARAKGRLLKGGEPDIEGAAKIVLSDWVRGRIPYFVAPPERSTELNEREVKERARLTKSKAREDAEEKRIPGVKQNLGSIMQKNTFVGEDLRSLEGIDLEGESEDANAEEEGDDDAASDNDDEMEEDAPLAWGDVFVEERNILPTKTAGSGAAGEKEEDWSGITSLPEEAMEHSGDESEESAKQGKEVRMTTNKKKAENFYTNANVKNKSRAKAMLLRSLQGKNGSRNRERKKR